MRYLLAFAAVIFLSLAPLLRLSAQTTPAAKKSGVEVPPAVDAAARKVVGAINTGKADGFFALLDATMRGVLPAEKAPEFIKGIREAKGKITRAKPLQAGPQNAIYLLTAERGEWQLSLTVDDAGLIAGLLITEPKSSSTVATSHIPLSLPFKGGWSVFWGGDNLKVNYHVDDNWQRRAADLLITGSNGKSFKTDGKLNHDYFCYGQEIIAVADGKVVAAIDGVPDNLPGAMDPYIIIGNAVIIEHDPKLYSAYCHLQRGTVAVKLDQIVKKGDLLGLCGNSGNSSEPHLHFQLHDGPDIGSALGVEPIFNNVSVTRGGKQQTIAKYRFLKGDVISAK